MGEAGGGEELSPFFASIFPPFPQKRLILSLEFSLISPNIVWVELDYQPVSIITLYFLKDK